MEEDPFNTTKYISEAGKLQRIFPEPIWLLIFNKFTGADQYHRTCAASPYFHKLLLPLRTQILFPDVVAILYCKTKTCYFINWAEEEKTKKEYFPLLIFRAVCKAWKQGVDALFHHIHSRTTAYHSDSIFNHWKARFHNWSLYHKFNTESKMDKFLKLFHNSHFLTGCNPFPSKSIYIKIQSQPAVSVTYPNKLLDIFRKYGYHIWHFCVVFKSLNKDEVQQVVVIFQSLLKLLPHLITLRIQDATWDHEGLPEYFQANLYANPLPQLEKLQLFGELNTEGSSFSHLIERNPQITKLMLWGLDLKKHSALFTTPLPNLEELNILWFESIQAFVHLQNVEVKWPLKKLTIYFVAENGDLDVNCVFNLIGSQWAGTLTDLNIIIKSFDSVLEIDSLKLPNLKYFSIQIVIKNDKLSYCPYPCMDFILPMSISLVSLAVMIKRRGFHELQLQDNSAEAHSRIKFFMYRENLLKSNIWKYSPRLREIKFAHSPFNHVRSYRRNNWEKYVEENDLKT